MNYSVAAAPVRKNQLTIVFDDSCPVVRQLGKSIRAMDRRQVFRFVGHDSESPDDQALVARQHESDWSLLFIDADGESFAGPEAIPFILKNLPSGRLAAVAYTLPGTMWLTRQLYYLVSRNRSMLSQPMVAPLRPITTAVAQESVKG